MEPPAGSTAGGFVLQMRVPCRTGRPITQEYIDELGIDACAWFDHEVFIERFGMDKYMEKCGKLERAGERAPGSRCTST